jgi:hypothetical protein
MHKREHGRCVAQFCFSPLFFPLPAAVFSLPMIFFTLISIPIPALSLAAFFTGTQDPAYITAVSLSPVTAAAKVKYHLTVSAADAYKGG